MAVDNTVIEALIKLSFAKATIEAAKQDLITLKAGLVDLYTTAAKGSQNVDILATKIAQINRASQIEKLGNDFGTLATKIKNTELATKLLNGRLLELGASASEIERAAGAFKDAENASQGGGIAGGLGVSALGGRLRQLPSTMIPGTSIGTDSIANILRMAGALENVSKTIPGVTAAATALTPALGATAAGFVAFLLPIAAVGVALAPLIIAFKILSDEADKTRKNFEAEIDAEITAQDLKQQNIDAEKTRTAEQNREKAAADQEAFDLQLALVNDLIYKRVQIDQKYANSSNPIERNMLAGEGQDLDKKLEEQNKKLIDMGLGIENTTRVLGPAIDAREAEETAIKKETDALKARQQSIADAGKVELEARNLAKNATEEQVKSLLESIATQREVLQKQADDSKKLFDETAEKANNGDKAAAEALGEIGKTTKNYTDQIVTLDARTKALTETTLKAAQANDKAKDAAKSLEDAGKAAIKYADAVTAANDKYYQDQIDAADKLADKQQEIQEQAVQAAEQLLQNLQEKYADLGKNLGRSLEDQDTKAAQDAVQKQINFQRQEVAAEKKFQDQIVQIKRKAQEDEFELSLDRDFAGLAKSRRQTANQVSDVTRQAQSERQDRLQAFRDQQDDTQRAFANERALKILQYQRQIADAQEAYARDQKQLTINRNRALVAAQQAEQKELTVLNDKHQKELTAKYNAAKVEIDLAQQTSVIRKQILDAEYAHALAIFQGISNLGSSGGGVGGLTPTQFAFGGTLSAGGVGLVNEPGSSGRETISGGGRTYKLPGAGIFKSFGNSTVNANRGGDSQMVTLAPTFNITNGNPDQVMKVIDDRLETTIKRIFKVKAS